MKNRVTYIQNGMSQDLFDVPLQTSVGVYNSPFVYYEVTPAAVNASLVVNGQVPQEGTGLLTLNPASLVTFQGQQVVQLDCMRSLTVTLSTPAVSICILTVIGTDIKDNVVEVTDTIAIGDTEVTTLKGFYRISQVTLSSVASGTVSVGTNSILTLPYYSCLWKGHMTNMTWNGANINPSIQFTPASNWRTTVPSSITSDCRGYVTLSSAPNGTAVFTCYYYAYGADSRLQADLSNNTYTSYKLIGAPNPPPYASPYPANTPPPELIALDETGVQYPGQMELYNQAMNAG